MPTGANKMIALSALITAGVLSLSEVQRGGGLPTTQQFAALSVAYLIMGASSDLGAPGLGSGLALLLMVSTLLIRGDDVLAYLGLKIPAKRRRRRLPEAEHAQRGGIPGVPFLAPLKP